MGELSPGLDTKQYQTTRSVYLSQPKIKSVQVMAKDKRNSVFFDREVNKFRGLDSQILKQLQETYEGIDIDNELKKMSLWLMSDTKGKTRKGHIGFIINWLNNATPMPPTTTEHLDLMQSDSPLGHLVRNYLMELWKDKDHILEFNTIRVKR